MLRLRRGRVITPEPLTVDVDGEHRRAWADPAVVGEVRGGDEVLVNTSAVDLGSGGFDVIHANLTRGLDAVQESTSHVMKLNYTSLQHPIEPVEVSIDEAAGAIDTTLPVLVIPLHGHLAPAAWAAGERRSATRVGYIQSAGGALPGSLSRDVAELRGRGLLAGHVTAAPAFGGEAEALSVAGALDAAARRLGWEAAIVGPGPGILGSGTRLGHGGIAAVDSAHAALALGLSTLVAPRLSTVRLPLHEIGRRGFAFAERQLAGGRPRREVLPTELIMRDSTAGAA